MGAGGSTVVQSRKHEIDLGEEGNNRGGGGWLGRKGRKKNAYFVVLPLTIVK
jgi:hypothetical protein